MDSFYIGPGKPWLKAGSWDDLIAAAQVGNFLETQWCESKLAVPASTPQANEELAKDLASLSVDGGVLLVGIRDKATAASDVLGVPDADVESLLTRIDQVCGSRVTPPLHISIDTIASPTPGSKVLVVQVPASPAAPHMVSERYWGRSATGKRPLGDADVERLIQNRHRRADMFEQSLLSLPDELDPLAVDQRGHGHLYVMLQPIASVQTRLTGALKGKRLIEIIVPAIGSMPGRDWSNLIDLQYDFPHADGFAAASHERAFWISEREDYLKAILLRDDGTIQYASGDSIMDIDGQSGISLPAVCETVQQLTAIAGYLAAGFLHQSGEWRIGLHLTELKGLPPTQAIGSSRMAYRVPAFQTDTYTKVITATLQQLLSPGSEVVEALAGDLARGLGIANKAFPYKDLSELRSRMGR